MPLAIACPSCGTRLQVPDNLAGRQVKCSKCGAVMLVPGAAAPPPAPAPPAAPRIARPTAPARAPGPPPPPPSPAPEPGTKAGGKTGLIIGLAAGAAGLLLVCCCGGGLVTYSLTSGMSEVNPKVTKEHFDRLKEGMPLGDVENVLGSGKPATLDDIRFAYHGDEGKDLDYDLDRWGGSVSRGLVYRWKNGNMIVLVAFNKSPREDGRAQLLVRSTVIGNGHEVQQTGSFPPK